jgi:hypothetical protein
VCSLTNRHAGACPFYYMFLIFAHREAAAGGYPYFRVFCSSASLAITCCSMVRRNSASLPVSSLSLTASICTAKRAALRAPPLPMAMVATGIPAGICTIDSSASSPFSGDESIGTAITGSTVPAAMTPARCAAQPAPAIMTFSPRSAALSAQRAARAGVRCADAMITS